MGDHRVRDPLNNRNNPDCCALGMGVKSARGDYVVSGDKEMIMSDFSAGIFAQGYAAAFSLTKIIVLKHIYCNRCEYQEKSCFI